MAGVDSVTDGSMSVGLDNLDWFFGLLPRAPRTPARMSSCGARASTRGEALEVEDGSALADADVTGRMLMVPSGSELLLMLLEVALSLTL